MAMNRRTQKVLFVHDYPPTEGGGVEVNVCKSARELVARGYEVVIATSRFSSETYKTTADVKELDGVKIILLDSMKKLQDLINWADVTHIYFTYSCRPASLEALRYCAENSKKCIFSIRTSHRHIPFSALGTMTSLEKESKLNFLRQYLSHEDVFISAPANCIKEGLVWLGVDKELHVIHNGTDFGVSPKNHMIPVVGLHDNDIAPADITYVGELSFLKGINYLIDAVKGLRSNGITVKVRLIGGGSDIREMRQLCDYNNLEDSVEFLGYIPNAKISQYLRKTSLYVQPSLTEVWSNSVLEALSLGVPVVCSNIEGLIEQSQSGKYAELVEVGNAAALEGALNRFFTDSSYREKRLDSSIDASKLISGRYTLDAQVAQMEDLYEKVLSS